MENTHRTRKYIHTPQISASELVIDKSINIVCRNDKRKKKTKQTKAIDYIIRKSAKCPFFRLKADRQKDNDRERLIEIEREGEREREKS